jgi:hypothetical protein
MRAAERQLRRPLATLVVLLAAACGRIDFIPLARDGSVVGMDTAMSEIDARVDVGSDTSRDAGDTGDAGTRPIFACTTPAPVLAEPPAIDYIEPALHVDGLTLVARPRAGASQEQASRASTTGLFGAFGPVSVIAAVLEDPTFIVFESQVIAAVALRTGPRTLAICIDPSATTTCDPIDVFDDDASLITDDVDGPSLAVIEGELRMAFSRGDAIYLARPRADALAEWDAFPLELWADGTRFDDPALTADGRFMFAPEQAIVGRLIVFRWNPVTSRYEDGTVLDFQGSSPNVGIDDGTTLELFVSAATRGLVEPHRVTCAITDG